MSIGRLKVVGQSNIDLDVPNKVEHKGLDGAIVGTVKVTKEAFHKAPIAPEHAMEAHHVKIVHLVLAILEEGFIALLFRHSNINVPFNEMRMLGHICQSPKNLVSTSLMQECFW